MSSQFPVRLIATDVDGTLLNSQGKLPEENRRAILDAQEKGITVAIASGRFPENVYMLLQDYGLSCPIVGTNGAQMTDARLVTLNEHFMLPEAAKAVQALLVAAGADYFIFGQRCVCTARQANHHHSELSHGERIEALGFTYLHGPQAAMACCEHPIYKFFVCDNVPLPPVREALSRIPDIELTQSSERNIEVMPAGVDKGRGVADMAAHLGIPLAQVMTLGDQENDIPMLRIAGFGVAMGNASPATRAAAKYCAESNDQCGFARAIRRLALSCDD